MYYYLRTGLAGEYNRYRGCFLRGAPSIESELLVFMEEEILFCSFFSFEQGLNLEVRSLLHIRIDWLHFY